jgi:hypothetical protein
MATTTNFGWSTPDDSANVKDGAAAIRSLGTAVDTTVATMVPKTLVDAKGDLIAATAADTVARLAVGANGTVLTAASGQATGLEWAALPSSNPTTADAAVATSESTDSNTYTNLTTTGPQVTLTTGTKVLVILSCRFNNAVGGEPRMSFAVSGATTIAASDAYSIFQNYSGSTFSHSLQVSKASVVTVTAGSNTFTAKYRSPDFSSRTWSNREIFVMNLN